MDYPNWICRSCGVKHGKRKTTGIIATWHIGTCDICNAEREVTEPRDFWHLKLGWQALLNLANTPESLKKILDE